MSVPPFPLTTLSQVCGTPCPMHVGLNSFAPAVVKVMMRIWEGRILCWAMKCTTRDIMVVVLPEPAIRAMGEG